MKDICIPPSDLMKTVQCRYLELVCPTRLGCKAFDHLRQPLLRQPKPLTWGGIPHAGRHLHVENRELLTGDCLLLVAFCLYKQV